MFHISCFRDAIKQTVSKGRERINNGWQGKWVYGMLRSSKTRLFEIPMKDLPNIVEECFKTPTQDELQVSQHSTHPPKILLLYGSLRKRSFSRLVVEECARLLEEFGCETKIFNPSGLPLPDDEDDSHPKVKELRDLMAWSEGQVLVLS